MGIFYLSGRHGVPLPPLKGPCCRPVTPASTEAPKQSRRIDTCCKLSDLLYDIIIENPFPVKLFLVHSCLISVLTGHEPAPPTASRIFSVMIYQRAGALKGCTAHLPEFLIWVIGGQHIQGIQGRTNSLSALGGNHSALTVALRITEARKEPFRHDYEHNTL